MVIYSFEDYREFLRFEFSRRGAARGGAAYELRDFALDCGVSPTRLAAVLHRQGNFSVTSALRLTQHLGLDARAREYFLLLVRHALSRSSRSKAHWQHRLEKIRGRPMVRQRALS